LELDGSRSPEPLLARCQRHTYFEVVQLPETYRHGPEPRRLHPLCFAARSPA
jgi:hypothetical protein